MAVACAMFSGVSLLLLPMVISGAQGSTKRALLLLWWALLLICLVSLWIAGMQYPCPKYC